MAVKREYEYFSAVIMGMAMLMAAGTSVAAPEETNRSKPQLPPTQATTEAPYFVNLARTTETKSRPFDSVAGGSSHMIYEQADVTGAILFILILILLTFLVIICIIRALFDFIFI